MCKNLNLRRSIDLPERRQFEAMTRLCNASIENHLFEMYLTHFLLVRVIGAIKSDFGANRIIYFLRRGKHTTSTASFPPFAHCCPGKFRNVRESEDHAWNQLLPLLAGGGWEQCSELNDVPVTRSPRSSFRRTPESNEIRRAKHTKTLVSCAAHIMFDWMIRFAHPFGAILRMFSALRATSGVRRDDDSYSDLRKTKKSSLDSSALSRE